MQIIDCETSEVLLSNAEQASTWWQRFRGLMFRRSFCVGYGLWIQPCGSIHTMWMRTPIDVYFIAKDGTVTEIREQVRPWSVVIPQQKCRSVLEIPHGGVRLVVGRRVQLVV
ncbi:MAG: DUF192 domain-containing protein [Pirellulaceae bacterium]